MKYIILTPVKYVAGKYELTEFETSADAGKFIAKNGLSDGRILVKRMDVEVSICEMMPSAQDDF